MATEIPNTIDINLSATNKVPFRIDGDDSRVVYVNTSDVGILKRISEVYPRLTELSERAANVMSEDTDISDIDTLSRVGTKLEEIDKEMRECIDYLFDAPVSAVAAPTGSMYDPFNGMCRFEYIITAFTQQYEKNISKETKAIKDQIKKHTGKYTGKK